MIFCHWIKYYLLGDLHEQRLLGLPREPSSRVSMSTGNLILRSIRRGKSALNSRFYPTRAVSVKGKDRKRSIYRARAGNINLLASIRAGSSMSCKMKGNGTGSRVCNKNLNKPRSVHRGALISCIWDKYSAESVD